MTKKNLKTLRSVGPSGLPRAALDKRNSLLKSIEIASVNVAQKLASLASSLVSLQPSNKIQY